jgi:hypothetical protein
MTERRRLAAIARGTSAPLQPPETGTPAQPFLPQAGGCTAESAA